MPSTRKLPGVLSFQRCLVPTDALFFDLFEDETTKPLPVVRHGIRGTQNLSKPARRASESVTPSSAIRAEVSNIQTTDSAKLAVGSTGLEVRFDLRFVNIENALFSCAPSKSDDVESIRDFREAVSKFVNDAKQSDGALQVFAERVSRNIANGRFLWRNRIVAKSVEVAVADEDAELGVFDALMKPLNSFDEIDDKERAVAEVIAAGLRGNRQATLHITARLDFGVRGPMEVFPSQNYLEAKDRGFARPLYCVGQLSPDAASYGEVRGQAALRDQKIGNALRTIDTWYPSFVDRGMPIPVEPNGANLDAQEFFRDRNTSGFKLLSRIDELTPDKSGDAVFLLACIIRGGVYSEGEAS